MKLSFDQIDRATALPVIRRVPASRIGAWLGAGWRDFKANPIPGIAYGLLFGIGGDLILLASLGQAHLFMVAVSGFFLVAPLLAAGLYELSRQHARGEHPTFVESLRAFRRNGESIALFGLVLALIAIAWERLSAIAFALLGNAASGDVGHFLTQTILSGEHTGFVIAWFAVGGILALLTFALSVVAVPLLLDRDSDVMTAMLTSLHAFAANTGMLLLWAATIVALTLFGFATLLFGLVIIMPILGHASWHAYRDLVE